MARTVDVVKRRLWAERLRRFEQSDLTVAAFCQVERVSDASFYQWRKKLQGTQERPVIGRQPVQQRSLGRARGTEVFVPLQIVQSAMIEIYLPNGARITLPAGDPATLETAVAVVARWQPAIGGEAR
ncbi:MAG: hypothetical protein HY000_04675 [Planctomycetes bacterium]|nr:hypothetical protein [Planctomycetota bacterium]